MNTSNMNSRIINTFPWGLHLNHTFDYFNPQYKYTGKNVEDPIKSKRIKIFDTNVPDIITMEIVIGDEDEEEVGLVKKQRKLPPLRLDTDTDTASESDEDEKKDIPIPVLRRQTTFWNDADGIAVYNGCPFGNRLMNK